MTRHWKMLLTLGGHVGDTDADGMLYVRISLVVIPRSMCMEFVQFVYCAL
jgi:hypothetical protein